MSPEVWMRGAIQGIAPALQPIAHSLLQVREELLAAIPTLSDAELSATPNGAASIDFHVRHIAGSIDRLFSYARGELLSDEQLAFLRDESVPSRRDASALSMTATNAIDRALIEVREWSLRSDEIYEARAVGRKQLPSTVIGLLFHAAEHAQRHAAQIATTVKVVRGAAEN
ncbi:MAG: DinB family protein [Gemmatimonadaceae bacterium]